MSFSVNQKTVAVKKRFKNLSEYYHMTYRKDRSVCVYVCAFNIHKEISEESPKCGRILSDF